MNARRVDEIKRHLARIASRRQGLSQMLSEIDDEREQLLAELENLDRKAFREEAL